MLKFIKKYLMNWEYHKYNIDINIKNELFRSYMIETKEIRKIVFIFDVKRYEDFKITNLKRKYRIC